MNSIDSLKPTNFESQQGNIQNKLELNIQRQRILVIIAGSFAAVSVFFFELQAGTIIAFAAAVVNAAAVLIGTLAVLLTLLPPDSITNNSPQQPQPSSIPSPAIINNASKQTVEEKKPTQLDRFRQASEKVQKVMMQSIKNSEQANREDKTKLEENKKKQLLQNEILKRALEWINHSNPGKEDALKYLNSNRTNENSESLEFSVNNSLYDLILIANQQAVKSQRNSKCLLDLYGLEEKRIVKLNKSSELLDVFRTWVFETSEFTKAEKKIVISYLPSQTVKILFCFMKHAKSLKSEFVKLNSVAPAA